MAGEKPIVVAGDNDLVFVSERLQPCNEPSELDLVPERQGVARMNKNIAVGDGDFLVAAMRVTYSNYPHRPYLSHIPCRSKQAGCSRNRLPSSCQVDSTPTRLPFRFSRLQSVYVKCFVMWQYHFVDSLHPVGQVLNIDVVPLSRVEAI